MNELQNRRRALMATQPTNPNTYKLLASGTYLHTGADANDNINIPVTYTGTAKVIYVKAHTILDATQQFVAGLRLFDVSGFDDAADYYTTGLNRSIRGRASNNAYYWADVGDFIQLTSTGFKLTGIGSYKVIQNNSYDWFIWGEE